MVTVAACLLPRFFLVPAAGVVPVHPKAPSPVGLDILISVSSHFWALGFAGENDFMMVGSLIPAWQLLRPADRLLC